MSSKNQNGIKKIQLRTKVTKFDVGGVIVECELTKQLEKFIMTKIAVINEIERKGNKLRDDLITAYTDGNTEQSVFDDISKSSEVLDKQQIEIYTEIINTLFINGTAEDALAVCRDVNGELNSITMGELITIVVENITAKVNTQLKRDLQEYKKH